MKIKLFAFFAISLALISCNKLKQTEKHIVGVWNIDNYEYSNFQGFTTKFESSGTFTISELSSSSGQYALNLSYQNETSNSSKIESGIIRIQNHESYILDRENSDGTITILEQGAINFLNKTQMQTTFKDEFGTHSFVLSQD